VAHQVQLAAFAFAIAATVALALRLGLSQARATVAGLLLAATPAALAMAGTAMPDVPAMGLGALAMERLIAWRDERRAHQALAASIVFALATLARPHLLTLAGPAALVLLGDKVFAL